VTLRGDEFENAQMISTTRTLMNRNQMTHRAAHTTSCWRFGRSILLRLSVALACVGLFGGTLIGQSDKLTEIKITFAHPPNPPAQPADLRYASLGQPGMGPNDHGAFAEIVANQISALKVTWSDPARFKTEAQTEELLGLLLTSSKTGTMTYHAWSWGDALPNVIASVEHKTGKPGKLILWCPPPGLYWAYQDGNGKWWWGYWDVMKFGLPRSVIPVAWPPNPSVKQDFDVQMQITKTQIILGEPLWVDVRITNRSSEILRIDTSDYCFMFDTRPLNVQIPAAQSGNGERDRRWNEHPGGDCFETQADMKPGETLTKRYVLSGDFRITHPGRYSVLLEKAIHYAQAPNTPPAGIAEKYTRLDQLQTVKSQISLDVLPANPEKLLAIEQTLADKVSNPIPITEVASIKNGQPISLDEFRRADDDRRKRERAESEDRNSITEALVTYPAAGMEPIFLAWLDRGDLEGHAITALYHLNTKEARRVLAQLAESPAKPNNSASQNHRLAAVYSLARMDDKSYVPLLENLAHDIDHGVRQQAILGLGMLGGEKELPFLTTLAREGATMSDRQEALMSMGDTASLKAIPILINFIVLPDSDQPSASTVALSRLTHHYLPVVERRSLLETQAAWQDWWKQNQRTARVYGPFEGSNGNAEPAVKK
jgi:hypothetical protein